jgi:hypothetical protein
MPRKHHTSDEALLHTVIEDLQSETPTRYAGALRALVSQGPLHCVALRPDQGNEREAEGGSLLIRAELWAFLRHMVLSKGHPEAFAGNGISMDSIRLFGNTASPHITLGIEATRRNVAILQLAFLVERVGLANVRPCGGSDCSRLFVKTYRREFCSTRCQKRHYMRLRRAKEQEQQRRRQKRRRTESAVVVVVTEGRARVVGRATLKGDSQSGRNG